MKSARHGNTIPMCVHLLKGRGRGGESCYSDYYSHSQGLVQWCRQGGAYGSICTQSIHQCTLYCNVYLPHVHNTCSYKSIEYVLLAKSPQPAVGMRTSM